MHHLTPEQQALSREIVRWWEALQPDEADYGKRVQRFGPFAALGRAERAQLRRCRQRDEVLLLAGFHRLAHVLGKLDGVSIARDDEGGGSAILLSDLALTVAVLTHAEHKPGAEFAKSLGSKNDAGRVPMSELRFQQLQTCRDEDMFFRQARRAVDLLRGKVDVGLLALDLLQWLQEYRQPDALPPQKRLKLRWASAYYQASFAEDADTEALPTDTLAGDTK